MLGQLELGDGLLMDLVRAVGQAQRAGAGIGLGQEEVLEQREARW